MPREQHCKNGAGEIKEGFLKEGTWNWTLKDN